MVCLHTFTPSGFATAACVCKLRRAIKHILMEARLHLLPMWENTTENERNQSGERGVKGSSKIIFSLKLIQVSNRGQRGPSAVTNGTSYLAFSFLFLICSIFFSWQMHWQRRNVCYRFLCVCVCVCVWWQRDPVCKTEHSLPQREAIASSHTNT